MNQLTRTLGDQVTDGLRHAMSQLAAGVVMVTTMVDGRPWGLTVSACCSVSMDPPMLLVSLGESTASAKAILETRRFGVSILGARTLGTAQFGSTRGEAKFIEPYCHDPADQASETPVIAGAIAHIDCHVAEVVRGGDHLIFIGDVVGVTTTQTADNALVYHDRRYHRLTADSDVGAAPAYLTWW
jgi:flavin reductase ActVB